MQNSLLHFSAALRKIFFRCHSAAPLRMALRTAFDHVDVRVTSLSSHSYVIRLVRSVHCWVSSGSCLAVSACVSAHSLSGSPRCALILTKKVRARCCVMMMLFIGTYSVTTTLNVHSRSRSFVSAIDLRGLAPSMRLFRRPNTNGMTK